MFYKCFFTAFFAAFLSSKFKSIKRFQFQMFLKAAGDESGRTEKSCSQFKKAVIEHLIALGNQ